jgi:hypothetical protein
MEPGLEKAVPAESSTREHWIVGNSTDHNSEESGVKLLDTENTLPQ